jgi:hypothetical protein
MQQSAAAVALTQQIRLIFSERERESATDADDYRSLFEPSGKESATTAKDKKTTTTEKERRFDGRTALTTTRESNRKAATGTDEGR